MAEGRSKLALALKVVGGLVTLVFAVIAILGARAGSALDARAADVQKRLEARRAAPAERPVLLGEPRDGNAADEYRGVEWVLGPGQRVQPWPTMIRPVLERDHPAANKLELGKLLQEAQEALDRGDSPSAEATALVDTYATVIEQLRRGVRSSRCDWGLKLEDGLSAETPNLVAMRQAAQLLALSAVREPDAREAARRGLEVVAFGRDLGRHASLIGAMVGVAVESLGLRSLERTLRARALPAAGYEEVVTTLGRLEPIDAATLFANERLGMECELARLTRRAPSKGMADALEMPAISRFPGVGSIFWEREWRGYVEMFEAMEAAVGPSPEGRDERVAAAKARVAASSFVLAAIALPDLAAFCVHVADAQARRDAVRVLAAAHLHRLATGAFPADGAALAERLGGAIPADPHLPGAHLVFEVVDAEARCYSVGADGKDDGGEDLAATKDGKDVGFRTKAPVH